MKTQQLEEIKAKETSFLYAPKGSLESYNGQHYELQYGEAIYLRYNDGGITPPEAYRVGIDVPEEEVPSLEQLLQEGYTEICYTPNPFL